jgi:hypothetical protein
MKRLLPLVALTLAGTAPSAEPIKSLVSHGLHGVFRMAQRRGVDFPPNRPATPRGNTRKLSGKARSRWVRTLGPCDQVVEGYQPYRRPAWMTQEDHEVLPVPRMVRECRYQVGRRGVRGRTVTLVTTLLDADRYPAAALADLDRHRWQVETDLAHRKRDVLPSQTGEEVAKELTAFTTVYNLVRLALVEASRRQSDGRKQFAGDAKLLSQPDGAGELVGHRTVAPPVPRVSASGGAVQDADFGRSKEVAEFAANQLGDLFGADSASEGIEQFVDRGHERNLPTVVLPQERERRRLVHPVRQNTPICVGDPCSGCSGPTPTNRTA